MKAKNSGFTLVELMFTVAVLAVLLAVGIPNFRDFIRNSRISGVANDLLADVSLARSEAVKRRLAVGLCSSEDPLDADAECVDPDDPGEFQGWIVFIDDPDPLADAGTDADGLRNNSEEILRRYVIPDSITTFADGSRLSFGGSGFVRPGIASTLTELLLCDDRRTAITAGGNSAARGIRVSQTGRAVVTRDKTDIEANFGDCT
jgi:prepilin-type N-terminal cleavage/methylation domain-containing protein